MTAAIFILDLHYLLQCGRIIVRFATFFLFIDELRSTCRQLNWWSAAAHQAFVRFAWPNVAIEEVEIAEQRPCGTGIDEAFTSQRFHFSFLQIVPIAQLVHAIFQQNHWKQRTNVFANFNDCDGIEKKFAVKIIHVPQNVIARKSPVRARAHPRKYQRTVNATKFLMIKVEEYFLCDEQLCVSCACSWHTLLQSYSTSDLCVKRAEPTRDRYMIVHFSIYSCTLELSITLSTCFTSSKDIKHMMENNKQQRKKKNNVNRMKQRVVC